MNLEVRTLRPEDASLIHALEEELSESTGDPSELMKRWSAPWRDESLNHYLPLGWSFGAWQKVDNADKLRGYFLAQPFVFFRELTQTLWLEHLCGDSREIKTYLLDVAYRCAREKHLQNLSIHRPELYQESLEDLALDWKQESFAVIKTAKLKDL